MRFLAFNSRNRKVAIHCVFSVKDNTLNFGGFCLLKAAGGDLGKEEAAMGDLGKLEAKSGWRANFSGGAREKQIPKAG